MHACIIRLARLTSNEICGQSLIYEWGKRDTDLADPGIGERLPDLTPCSLKGPQVHAGGSREKSLEKWITILHNLYDLLFSKTDDQISSWRPEGEPGSPWGEQGGLRQTKCRNKLSKPPQAGVISCHLAPALPCSAYGRPSPSGSWKSPTVSPVVSFQPACPRRLGDL